MILQSLVNLYEDLSAKGSISGPGWAKEKIGFSLYIDDNGTITDVVSLRDEDHKGQEKDVPVRTARSGKKIASNFLWDNSGYILGAKQNEAPAKSKACFDECRRLHEEILAGVTSPAAMAILAFFASWNPDKIADNKTIQEYMPDIISGANITFRYNEEFAFDNDSIKAAWQKHYLASNDGQKGICLVTGEKTDLTRLHPKIKGVRNAQQAGANLVSFDKDAFCSYGKKQGMNAQTGEYAAFAYGAALNYLISDQDHISYIGDTTVLCWAAGADPVYQSAFCNFVFGQSAKYSENDLKGMMKSLCAGKPVEYDDTKLDPAREFYVLGIAPNAARLSVRFFLRNSFGSIVKNVNAHYERLEIEKPTFKERPLSVGRLLNETVNQNSKDKSASPQLAGELLRAILNNSIYPATLLNGIVLRIRAEHEINYEKAAMIKAYYLKNRNKDVPEEVLTVSLNRETTNTAYVLGRLFSVLEDIQKAANPGINATIRDKFFNSASATPAVVFPQLVNLAQKHIRKLERWAQVKYDKQLGEILGQLQDEFPARLSLPQQGAFQLGYYHQAQAKYAKNHEEEE